MGATEKGDWGDLTQQQPHEVRSGDSRNRISQTSAALASLHRGDFFPSIFFAAACLLPVHHPPPNQPTTQYLGPLDREPVVGQKHLPQSRLTASRYLLSRNLTCPKRTSIAPDSLHAQGGPCHPWASLTHAAKLALAPGASTRIMAFRPPLKPFADKARKPWCKPHMLHTETAGQVPKLIRIAEDGDEAVRRT